MSNDQLNPNALNPKPNFDLEERTAKFSEQIIDFVKKLPQNNLEIPKPKWKKINNWELVIGNLKGFRI